MPRNRIIPVFIPHAGCPHQCVFCDQNRISGASAPVSPAQLRQMLDEAHCGPDTELAFYGGSFTAIDPAYQEALLSVAAHEVMAGRLRSIRLSTRPDAIDADVIARLRRYPVTTVELGCQSMDDSVLQQSGRGHCADDCRKAAQMLKRAGFSVILQMMPGLPGADEASDLATGEAILALRPDGVRIYPTVVVRGTPLEQLWRSGRYIPLTVEEAALRCATLCERFTATGIPVLRMGLNPTDGLSGGDALAGPYHPAFGELALCALWYRKAQRLLPPYRGAGHVTLFVAPRHLSQLTGHGRAVIRALEAEFSIAELDIRTKPMEEWHIDLQSESNSDIIN